MGSYPMLQKEMKEVAKSYKLLLVPLVFTLLTIMQPIMLKMLPSLLKNSSDLPPGTVIKIPDPTVADVLGSILPSFETMGAIIIILIAMGTIANERSTGVASMVLVKPVGISRYFFSKVISYSLLISGSLLVAMVSAAYYTDILYTGVNWENVGIGTLLYLPNLLLILSVTLFFSTILTSQVGVGGASFVSYLILSTVPQYLSKFIKSISPNELLLRSSDILKGVPDVEILSPFIGVTCLTVLFTLAAWAAMERQEF